MVKHIAAITFIYLCVCAAWIILGNVVLGRSYASQDSMGAGVQQLWGAAQVQRQPEFEMVWIDANDKKEHAKQTSANSTKVNAVLALEQRKKGLVWYPTYKVKFAGDYVVANNEDSPQILRCKMALPDAQSVYDNLVISVGKDQVDAVPKNGELIATTILQPHEQRVVHFAYDSQGSDMWQYGAASSGSPVRNLTIDVKTDFDKIDFPAGTRSPTSKHREGKGWDLQWAYHNTIAGAAVGVAMPHLLNPGPWVSQVTFFAPVSLFFFFFVLWLITTIKAIRIHPMHYFFIGASFFAFHLLLAYSVDHIPVEAAFALASAVSIFLVLSYIRRAVPNQRLFTQVGLAQFVYLVFFSFTFFVQEFTGLIITGLSILTLFICMQYTARFDWSVGVKQNLLVQEDPLALIEQEYS
jgi:hypothetical protein